ncbi:P-loop containing nucleoside triphosphate hydrolase protein [Dipodascopsis tothii]|uniref:P-loop containing nucleoside triphosphate hydrolase protein n=1 Tax=Dipodascopsis tothii TaxID=44089 RepID=UPI0034CDA24F
MIKDRVSLSALANVALFLGSGLSIYYALSYLISNATEGPTAVEAKKRSEAALKRFTARRPDLDLDLDEYEKLILAEVIAPEDISVGFDDIGGLEDIVDDLRESVLYPLTVPGLFSSGSPLLSAPKGVLLYGPPGCGKTMLAKALAAESSATFINIKMSTILDKWFGQSNKLVAAIFSLAHKLQPSIVFIDEIDSFLRERQKMDHEVTSMLKAEFMTLWDGLTSDGRILVLGATNRPNDIDSAFLRRMPKRFAVRLPKPPQRRKILELLLRGTELDPEFDLDAVVANTAGMSGSDIKEACRDAVMVPAREYFREHYAAAKGGAVPRAPADTRIRALKTTDFFLGQPATEEFGETLSSALD